MEQHLLAPGARPAGAQVRSGLAEAAAQRQEERESPAEGLQAQLHSRRLERDPPERSRPPGEFLFDSRPPLAFPRTLPLSEALSLTQESSPPPRPASQVSALQSHALCRRLPPGTSSLVKQRTTPASFPWGIAESLQGTNPQQGAREKGARGSNAPSAAGVAAGHRSGACFRIRVHANGAFVQVLPFRLLCVPSEDGTCAIVKCRRRTRLRPGGLPPAPSFFPCNRGRVEPSSFPRTLSRNAASTSNLPKCRPFMERQGIAPSRVGSRRSVLPAKIIFTSWLNNTGYYWEEVILGQAVCLYSLHLSDKHLTQQHPPRLYTGPEIDPSFSQGDFLSSEKTEGCCATIDQGCAEGHTVITFCFCLEKYSEFVFRFGWFCPIEVLPM